MPRLIRYVRYLVQHGRSAPGDVVFCSRGRRYVVGPAGNLIRREKRHG